MLLLAYQSTGNETLDFPKICERLGQRKKVEVHLDGFQDDIRQQISTLFGRDCIKDMRLINKDKVSLQETWQCSLLQPTAEEAAWYKQDTYAEEEDDEPEEVVMMEQGGSTDILDKTMLEVRRYFKDLRIDDLTLMRLPPAVLKEIRSIAHQSKIMYSHDQIAKVACGVSERIFEHLMSMYPQSISGSFTEVQHDDIRLTSYLYQATEGNNPKNVLFGNRGDHLMEADRLYYDRAEDCFVGFDVTTQRRKRGYTAYKNAVATLADISHGIQERILMTDVIMRPNSAFDLRQMGTDFFKMKLNCTLDVYKVASSLILRRPLLSSSMTS